jgi:hypothetical protein
VPRVAARASQGKSRTGFFRQTEKYSLDSGRKIPRLTGAEIRLICREIGASSNDPASKMDEILAPLIPLQPHGRRPDAPRNERGEYVSEPQTSHVKSGGNSRTYIIRRLSRDGHHELTGLVRSRKISAREASIRAGWGGSPRTHRQPKPDEPKPIDPETFAKILVG